MNITVEAVVAGYGEGPDIVRGTSLTASPGDVTTLLGPNGCGKSTLLRTMSRLLAPRSGRRRRRPLAFGPRLRPPRGRAPSASGGAGGADCR